MKSTFGNYLKYTLFGASHDNYIGITIDGIPAGFSFNFNSIHEQLKLRAGMLRYNTPRNEKDNFEIISGYYNDKTTGHPITIILKNLNTNSKSYTKFQDTPRPGHTDYVANEKYNSFNDARGGGHFSGRMTAAIVVFGEIASQIIEKISPQTKIMTHILNFGKYKDINYYEIFKQEYEKNDDIQKVYKIIEKKLRALNLKEQKLPIINVNLENEINEFARKVKQSKDTIGGSLETIVINPPKFIGEPYFNSMESVISSLLFSVPSVKGVLFGNCDEFEVNFGSNVKDEIEKYQDEQIYTKNNNGGINGGITNGEPIITKTIIKPIASLKQTQMTYSFKEEKITTLNVGGRHDCTVINRICPVINAIFAIGILDLLLVNKGTNL